MNNKTKSILWVLSWVLTFSTAMALAKGLKAEIPTAYLVFARSCFGICVLLPLILKEGFKSSFSSEQPGLTVFRAFLSACTMGMTYFAYRNLPVALATAIGFSGPLFVTTMAVFILKERVSKKGWGFLLLGYLGVLIIAQPGQIELSLGLIAALCANLVAGVILSLVKLLSRTDKVITIILYPTLMTLCLSGAACFFFEYSPTLSHILQLAIIGVFGAISGISVAQAIKLSSPAFIAPFEYTRLVYAIPVGFFFFQELPTMWTYIGGCIIVFATWQVTRLRKV